MKKVMIFGCGGFVGSYLAEEFALHGYSVIGTDVVNSNFASNSLFSDFYIANILDFQLISSLIEKTKPDYIINLAAISSVGDSWNIPQKTVEINVNGTLNILEGVKKWGASPKVLLIGSSEEYAVSSERITEDFPIDANNPYGISKVMQEHFSDLYRSKYGMRIINTRTFNHTGVGQADRFAIPSFVKQAAEIHKSGKPGTICTGNLTVKRDLGDVRDMVAAYRMILESDSMGTVFNVGSGHCYLLSDILNFIIGLSDVDIEVVTDAGKIRPSDNPVIWCDNSYITHEIGWKPKYTIFDAVRRMFEYYVNVV